MKPILKDKEEFPTIENLANHLSQKNLALYQQLLEEIHACSFKEDWNYYNDGKTWLSKILFKKKNLGWISIWETGVKVTVYFGERVWPQLVANELFNKLEANDASIQKSGKLNAVLIPIQDETSLHVAIELVNLKKNIK
ncbi:DUF3788 family protein [Enterococcus malodoratus]|uniref:DUF3788 family protein n=1 Tax=Enterococcus malodoratus ATCC 43197 TaxID=1158601 RepID=R2NSN2_9ENTE|nr:DUF3788 family protein [Enterococcus malodoratus]EOH75057.1 hypothetical protein UAI_03298 [Enterococcus malodoratus ATCC 43197]EOT66959.1 hypothetical protein I585_02480 [Enterococcus malodoratus ATCC 43197]OJG63659.1 hypothetical protein RV07_GL000966 [Enterococcus malodoratus]SPX03919.1 Protein of uncharacterised function (DUF3788) [Enterococcus malodoratus]STD69789.1 Protein of uncharacterised function (DUF3788) [Enterococcus malodoratus]